MKNSKIIIAFSAVILTVITVLVPAGCSKNARPFEMLLGIAPLPDVDFSGIPEIYSSVHTNLTNIIPWEWEMEDADLSWDSVNTNILVLSKNTVYEIIPMFTNLMWINTNTYTIPILEENRGLAYDGTYYVSGSGEEEDTQINFYQTGTGQELDRQNHISLSGFQTKYICYDQSKYFWLVRLHNPILTDNSYPESETPNTHEFIRKMYFNPSGNEEDAYQLMSFRVPGDECRGITWLNGHLYVILHDFYKEGRRIEENHDEYRIYKIDPDGMDFVGKSSLTFNSTYGLTSDGTYLWIITETSQYSGDLVFKRIQIE